MQILLLGAGAFGTALAIAAGTRHPVTLWARDPDQARDIREAGENSRYLSGYPLGSGVRVVSTPVAELPALAARHDLVIVATPMAGLRAMLVALRAAGRPVAWLCKGFEVPVSQPYGLLGHEIRAEVAPGLAAGVLSGPSFAQEVARGQPTALVAASESPQLRDALVAAFHGPAMRVYANPDVVGVEVGGAVKNVLAIATGLCDGLELGLNARAALITRGLAEMTRLGVALGADPATFMGLSGMGDLVLTATGDLSRNRRVGLLLAQGYSLPQAVASLGHVAEGVYCARTVVERGHRLGVELPICAQVVDLLDGRIGPRQAVAALMGRGPAHEGSPSPAP